MFRWLRTEENLFAAETAAIRDIQQAPGLMKMAAMIAAQRTEQIEVKAQRETGLGSLNDSPE